MGREQENTIVDVRGIPARVARLSFFVVDPKLWANMKQSDGGICQRCIQVKSSLSVWISWLLENAQRNIGCLRTFNYILVA